MEFLSGADLETVFNLKSGEIEQKLSEYVKKGMTEFNLYDSAYANDKNKLMGFLKYVEQNVPGLFVSFIVNPEILDMEICRQCMKINSSLELPFRTQENGLFDKKFFARRATMLNNSELVFGVQLFYAENNNDSLKAFRERLDFAVEQFPNHISFPQTEDSESAQTAHVQQTFSAEDIRTARDIAFACRTFYSAGRAVPWFNSILRALRISPSVFFSDFAEWQRCNNCDYKSGFVPEDVSHHEIEKMQLIFLEQKFEEKKKGNMFTACNDIVCMNGALSRLVSDGTESVLEIDYDPEEIFGPEAMDLNAFVNDLCMEHCTVKIFLNEDGEPDFKVL